MANVEITEEELGLARNAITLLQTLRANPDTQADFERAVKKIKPDYRTAEETNAAILAPLQQQIETLQTTLKERDEAEKKAKEEAEAAEAKARLESGFQRLREAGLTDEGLTEVQKIMKDRQVYDPEAAFALFERQNPKPRLEQAGWVPPTWNYEEDVMPDAKAWFVNTDKAEEDTIGQVLLEMRRGREE